MNGRCNLNNVIYQAIIYPKEDITDKKTYIGLASTKWKQRFLNQKLTFSHEHLKKPYGTIKTFLVFKKQMFNPWYWMVYFVKIKYSK